MSDLSTGPVGGGIWIEEHDGVDGEKTAEGVTEAEDELDEDLQANAHIADE
jgi:hypothetical protein